MTRPILIKIKHIYGATKSSLPVPDRHLTQRCRCCVSAAVRSACSLAWRNISSAAACCLGKKNVVANAACEHRCERERRCASCERMREGERGRAAAACDERRCCCSATAGAVKFCKAEAPCWCSWRATVLLEFQSQKKAKC